MNVVNNVQELGQKKSVKNVADCDVELGQSLCEWCKGVHGTILAVSIELRVQAMRMKHLWGEHKTFGLWNASIHTCKYKCAHTYEEAFNQTHLVKRFRIMHFINCFIGTCLRYAQHCTASFTFIFFTSGSSIREIYPRETWKFTDAMDEKEESLIK